MGGEGRGVGALSWQKVFGRGRKWVRWLGRLVLLETWGVVLGGWPIGKIID